MRSHLHTWGKNADGSAGIGCRCGGIAAGTRSAGIRTMKDGCVMVKRLSWTAILICAALAACGGDEGDGSPAPTAGGGAGGTVAPVGGGGAGGARAGAGAGGAMPPAPVMCGGMTCPDPYAALSSNPLAGMFAAFLPKVCCVTATSKCGVMGAMQPTCTEPPPPDPMCPMLGGLIPTANCCAMTPAGGLCGVDATAFGMGCWISIPFGGACSARSSCRRRPRAAVLTRLPS